MKGSMFKALKLGMLCVVAAFIVACESENPAKEPDIHGRTPVHYAGRNGDAEALTALFQSEGIDPNELDADGVAPIHRVARDGQMDLMAIL